MSDPRQPDDGPLETLEREDASAETSADETSGGSDTEPSTGSAKTDGSPQTTTQSNGPAETSDGAPEGPDRKALRRTIWPASFPGGSLKETEEASDAAGEAAPEDEPVLAADKLGETDPEPTAAPQGSEPRDPIPVGAPVAEDRVRPLTRAAERSPGQPPRQPSRQPGADPTRQRPAPGRQEPNRAAQNRSNQNRPNQNRRAEGRPGEGQPQGRRPAPHGPGGLAQTPQEPSVTGEVQGEAQGETGRPAGRDPNRRRTGKRKKVAQTPQGRGMGQRQGRDQSRDQGRDAARAGAEGDQRSREERQRRPRPRPAGEGEDRSEDQRPPSDQRASDQRTGGATATRPAAGASSASGQSAEASRPAEARDAHNAQSQAGSASPNTTGDTETVTAAPLTAKTDADGEAQTDEKAAAATSAASTTAAPTTAGVTAKADKDKTTGLRKKTGGFTSTETLRSAQPVQLELEPKYKPLGASEILAKSTTLVPMNPLDAIILLVGTLTLMRLFVVFLSPLELGPDEAQYWSWSQELAFGYFSKPPMLAWLIGFSTALCGDGESCVRAVSPILHGGTSILLFLCGRALFPGPMGTRIGILAGLTYATMPAVWLSSALASTDVPLLFFWTLALFALWRAIAGFHTGWAVVLGVALGAGLLSKYAMLFFVLGAGLFLLIDSEARRAMWPGRAILALLIAGAIVAPNLLWNLQNDFATVGHTASNANWGTDLFNPVNFVRFFLEQFGVFGPILFATLIWGVLTLSQRMNQLPGHRSQIYLLCFIVPPLAIIGTQAFLSRANANWAATSYAAASILVVAWLASSRRRWLIPASLAIHTVFGLALYAMAVSPDLVERLGRTNDFKRLNGWSELGSKLEIEAEIGHEGEPFSSILVNDRLVFAALQYYAPALPVPLTMWDHDGVPSNQFELTHPLTPDLAERVLFLVRANGPRRTLDSFASAEDLGLISTRTSGERTREFRLYALSGYAGGAPSRNAESLSLETSDLDDLEPWLSDEPREPEPVLKPDTTGSSEDDPEQAMRTAPGRQGLWPRRRAE